MFTEAEVSLVSYLSGWLVRKCAICVQCQDVLTKRSGDHSYRYNPKIFFQRISDTLNVDLSV